MIIKLKFKLINCSNLTIGISHINTKSKTEKYLTIIVLQLNETWKRVSAEVLGQDGLGRMRHLIKKGNAIR